MHSGRCSVVHISSYTRLETNTLLWIDVPTELLQTLLELKPKRWSGQYVEGEIMWIVMLGTKISTATSIEVQHSRCGAHSEKKYE